MKHVIDPLKNFTRDESGTTALEYGPLVAWVAWVALIITVGITDLGAELGLFLAASSQDIQPLFEQQASLLSCKETAQSFKACEFSNRRKTASFLKSIHGGEVKILCRCKVCRDEV